MMVFRNRVCVCMCVCACVCVVAVESSLIPGDLTLIQFFLLLIVHLGLFFFFSLPVFKDSSQKDLLNFTGTIPVMYQGKCGS